MIFENKNCFMKPTSFSSADRNPVRELKKFEIPEPAITSKSKSKSNMRYERL